MPVPCGDAGGLSRIRPPYPQRVVKGDLMRRRYIALDADTVRLGYCLTPYQQLRLYNGGRCSIIFPFLITYIHISIPLCYLKEHHIQTV